MGPICTGSERVLDASDRAPDPGLQNQYLEFEPEFSGGICSQELRLAGLSDDPPALIWSRGANRDNGYKELGICIKSGLVAIGS